MNIAGKHNRSYTPLGSIPDPANIFSKKSENDCFMYVCMYTGMNLNVGSLIIMLNGMESSDIITDFNKVTGF